MFSVIETAAARIAAFLPFGYAFGAGMVASVNPCGFLMLPAFGTYYLGAEEESFLKSPAPVRVLRAVALAATATAGFVLLFGAVGLTLSLGGRALIGLFPWGGFLIGIALTALGLWLLVSGHSLGILQASRVQASFGKGTGNVFLFGVAYGVCSLSCTLPIFLVVVGTALATGSLVDGLGQFVNYGLGMGMVLALVTVSIAAFGGTLTRRLRALLPYVHRAGAVFLMAAGLYIVYYWVVLGQLFG